MTGDFTIPMLGSFGGGFGRIPVVTVTASDPQASEAGDEGIFTIHRSEWNKWCDLPVSFTVSGTATDEVDYAKSFPGGYIGFNYGSTSEHIVISPIKDDIAEGDETVVITLDTPSPPSGFYQYGWDCPSYIVGTPGSATVTIADTGSGNPEDLIEDPAGIPTVSITAVNPNAAESGPAPGAFKVSRTGSTVAALTVQYSIGGTATNGTDYSHLSGSVTIPAGLASAIITVTPLEDTIAEGVETVELTLLSSASYNIGTPGKATVFIADSGDNGGSNGSWRDWEEKLNVAVDHKWTITFNYFLKPESVNSNNIYIKDETGEPVGTRLEINPDGKSVQVIPHANYEHNQVYYLYITKDLSSADGRKLKENIRMKFTTL